MNLVIIASLCCLALVINAATVPLSDEKLNNPNHLTRQKRSPLILTALGLGLLKAGIVGAGIVGAGVAGLAGAGLVGAGLGAKAGFVAGTLAGSSGRSYASSYTYSYDNARPLENNDYVYRAQLRVQG